MTFKTGFWKCELELNFILELTIKNKYKISPFTGFEPGTAKFGGHLFTVYDPTTISPRPLLLNKYGLLRWKNPKHGGFDPGTTEFGDHLSTVLSQHFITLGTTTEQFC